MRRSRAGSKHPRPVAPLVAGEGGAAEPEAEGEPRPLGDQRRRRRRPATPQPRPSTKRRSRTTLSAVHQRAAAPGRRGCAPSRSASRSARRSRSPPARPRCGSRGRCAPAPRPRARRARAGRPPRRPRACAGDEDEAGGGADHQAAHQERPGLGGLAGAAGLGDEAGGAHAQEAEDPVDRGRMIAPSPTAPIGAAWPSWPTTAVSTAPRIGIVALESDDRHARWRARGGG